MENSENMEKTENTIEPAQRIKSFLFPKNNTVCKRNYLLPYRILLVELPLVAVLFHLNQ